MSGPRYEWPHGAPTAVLLTFDVDAEAPHLWRSRDGAPRLAELEQRRFGPRQGLARLLDLLADKGLTGTFYVPGYVARRHSAAVADIASAGHELALHGDVHEPPADLSAAAFREVTARSIDALASITGSVPAGFRSPSWDMTRDAFETLTEFGLEHDSSLMGHDRPYWIESLVEIPVHWALDDAPYYRYVGRGDTSPPAPPTTLMRAWLHELRAAVRFGSLLNLTMHPWMSGRAGPALALGELLDAVATAGAWVGTVSDLARWHGDHGDAGERISFDELAGGAP